MAGSLDAASRVIPTAVHAPLDYLTAGTTVALPTLLGQRPGPSRTATRAWGAMAFVSGVTTRHELGLVRALPMRYHLAGDALGGAALMALPWLTGDRDGPRQWLPPTVIGATEILLAATTTAGSALPRPLGQRLAAAGGSVALAAGLLLTPRSPAAVVLAGAGLVAVAAATRTPARSLPAGG